MPPHTLPFCAAQAAGVEEPAGATHMLPLLDFPVFDIGLRYEWVLPGGRSSLEHHLFPVPPVVCLSTYKLSCSSCPILVHTTGLPQTPKHLGVVGREPCREEIEDVLVALFCGPALHKYERNGMFECTSPDAPFE